MKYQINRKNITSYENKCDTFKFLVFVMFENIKTIKIVLIHFLSNCFSLTDCFSSKNILIISFHFLKKSN